VHDQVKNKLALGFNFMGHQQVKNINDHVPVFVVTHDAAPSLPIAGVGEGSAPRAAAMAPALLPLRFGAFVVDAVVAAALLFAGAAALQNSYGPVFAIDAPFNLLASVRTVSNDLPSIEVSGGAERTTVRSVVERNYFGLFRQTFRRIDVEEKRQEAGRAGIRSISRSSREMLLDARGRETARPPLSIAAIVFYFLMMIVTEGLLLRGASPGKIVMGLRVSRVDGESPDLGGAAIRNLAKVLSAGTVVGMIMALWSKRRQMLHDQLAGSYVHDAR
jgi:uncharacterized RDD family membrane protein YckC